MKTESQTRGELIDKALANAGWDVHDLQQVVQNYHIKNQRADVVGEPGKENNLFADYVLLNRYNKPIAVIEAKKTAKDAASGKEQGYQYAQAISVTTN